VVARRHADVLPLARILSLGGVSVYDLGAGSIDLVPSSEEVERAIRAVEAAYPDLGRLTAEAERWYEASPA
jgi:hypothetical protein